MSSARRRARLIKAAGVVLVALFLGWAAICNAVLLTLPHSSAVAVVLVGKDPRFKLDRALARFSDTLQYPDPEDYAGMMDAAGSLPLAAEPFIFAALRATRDGENARSTRLLEEARHRAPRFQLGRVLLLDRYIRAGRTADAVDELVGLSHILPDVSDVLTGRMVALAFDPNTASVVRSFLVTDPIYANQVLAAMADQGGDPDFILKTAGALPVRIHDGGDDWRNHLMNEYLRRDDYARARQLWGAINGLPTPATGVFDSRMHRPDAPPPFGWSVASSNIGSVEWKHGGGFSIEYYGREAGPLAQQMLTLPPGRYRLETNFEIGSKVGRSSMIAWQVRCIKSGTQLLVFTVGSSRQAGVFAVPADCPAQALVLQGVAGEFPDTIDADVDGVSIGLDGGQR